jgi:PAS domain S-box-containing protein
MKLGNGLLDRIRKLNANLDAKEREEALIHLFEATDDLILVCGVEGEIFMASPSASADLGWSHEELRKMGWVALIALGYEDEAVGAIERLKKNGNSRDVIGLKTKNLDDKIYQWNSILVDNRIYTIGRDITGHLNLDRQKRLLDQEFRLVFEQSPVGFAIASLDGQLMKVNQALCDILQYNASELITMTWQDITHPDDIKLGNDLAKKCFNNQIKAFNLRKRYIRRDGTAIYALLAASAIHDPDNLAEPPMFIVAQIIDLDKLLKDSENDE